MNTNGSHKVSPSEKNASELIEKAITANEERRQRELEYLLSLVREHQLPNEEYIGSIGENGVSTHPYNTKRIGPVLYVNVDKGGERGFRPIYIYPEKETHRGSSIPRIEGQEHVENFYGYIRKSEASNLPQLPGMRIGLKSIIRECVELMPVFVTRPANESMSITPKTVRHRQYRVKTHTEKAPQRPRKPLILAADRALFTPTPTRKLKDGDKVTLEVGSKVMFTTETSVPKPSCILKGTYPGVIRYLDNVLWLEIYSGTRKLYKALGELEQFPDVYRITEQ